MTLPAVAVAVVAVVVVPVVVVVAVAVAALKCFLTMMTRISLVATD